ncbi:MAG: carbamoyltransferase N-terminal domain-containing protein [Anaerolineae bacterium]|nr:carbamoyltransferase N-terminal domain-containing protein [Anaerolineae bacterium]
MYILGISAFYHDSAAALIQDGKIIAASMEERFSRKKHDNSFPTLAVKFCLEQAGISVNDLDWVVFYEKPLVKFERILLTTLNTFPKSWDVWREAMVSWLKEKLWVKTAIQNEVGVRYDKILFADHHMSHAASAFFTSPFKEAAVLTVDGVGEWTTTTLGKASSYYEGESGSNNIDLFAEQRFPHSIGLLYSTFTAWLGFRVNNGEYKVMGMSPYGEANYLDKIHKVVNIDYQTGAYSMNMEYFEYHHSIDRSYSQKFVDLFGSQRDADVDFFTAKTNPEMPHEKAMDTNQYYADIAASIQQVTEDALIAMCHELHRKTGLNKLVMAGGVALNTKANWRLLNETPFEEIYIQPAAGDDGGALGAALWVYHIMEGKARVKNNMPHSYWGKGYSDAECKAFLDERGLKYESFDENPDKLVEVLVDEMVNKQSVIALHQGRFEWGPRALGNRSILADPRGSEMKEVVNTKIKFREPFRPFAPVILRDRAPEYFDYPEVATHEAPKYMLMVAPFKDEVKDKVQAVNHEGTGRLQAIDRESNPRYYDIVKTFGDATGVPVVLNTSFNLRGEPIVNTPRDAFNTFNNSDIDLLALGSFLIRKPL